MGNGFDRNGLGGRIRARAGLVRLAFLRLSFAALLAAAGVSAAQAACQSSVDFTGMSVGATVTFDVSSCTNDIRSGLYDPTSVGNSNGNNYPMHADATPATTLAVQPYTFIMSNGAKVTVTPTQGGFYIDTYTFSLDALPTPGGTQTLKLYYAAGSDAGGKAGFGTINTPYPISITFPAATATVPGAPVIGTATAGDAQATVSFSAPSSDGGAAITSYTATSNPGGITASGTTSPITVTGLTNGQSYTFTVTATNSVGTGPASAPSNSVTPKANQTITFANPGSQNYGTTPTLTASASSGLVVSFSSTTPAVCTITSGGALTFVTTGTCTIDADQSGNTVFNAAPTVSQSFAVNPVVPGAPVIGTATAGDGQATVNFSAPASDGGAAITSYTATSNPGGFTATGASGPITVTGLTNGQSYTFTVTATNSVGTGPASAASNSVTPLAPPVAGPVSVTIAYDAAATNVPLSLSGGTAASVAVASPASHGTATASGTTISYKPASGFYGSDSFTYSATNASGTSAAATVTVTVSAPSITVSPTSLAAGTVGTSYNQSLTASGGAGPYTFNTVVATGALPPGLSLSSTGVVNGTPTATGSFSFTVSGSDSSTPTPASFTSGTITLQVNPGVPVVNAISPSSGPALGGTSVTLTGTQFTGATAVHFGASAASSFTVNSATSITATAPAEAAGTVDVTVTTPSGTSVASSADKFTYLSSTATLSGLGLSQGTLSPAFASGTTGYSVALPNGTASITVTPTLTDTTGTVTVNGTAVASGSASGPITLATGANSIAVVVTAQDGVTTRSYSVTANVALPSDTITFGPVPSVIVGSAPFNLTATAASGLPVTLSSTSPTLCAISGTTVTILSAGNCTIQGTTTGNSAFAPASATLTIPIGTRPDPSRDPLVIALIQAQNQMAQNFAGAQIQNFGAHLEQLHQGGAVRDDFSLQLALPQVTRNAGFDETSAAPPGAAAGNAQGPAQGRGTAARGTARGTAVDPHGNLFGPGIGIWTGGSLSLFKNDAFTIHSDGLSAGIDFQLSPRAVVGFGLGYGFGKTELGAGSWSNGHATSVVLYGSLSPAPNAFIDILAGRSDLSFTSVRAVTGTSDTAFGKRGGMEVFGQISAGLEYRTPRWMLSPYARFTRIAGHLDAFTESATNPANALSYGRQSFGSTELSLGLRGELTRKAEFGRVIPYFRAEYHHLFEQDALAGLSYANLVNGPQYVLNLPGSGQNLVTLGLGVDMRFYDGLDVALAYDNTFGASSRSQRLSAQLRLEF